MFNQFRLVSMVEGLSLLVLLLIAMPIKYGLGYPLAVTLVGWTHGLLFMLYVYLAAGMAQRYANSGFSLMQAILLGMVPFGCFVMERRLKRLALVVEKA